MSESATLRLFNNTDVMLLYLVEDPISCCTIKQASGEGQLPSVQSFIRRSSLFTLLQPYLAGATQVSRLGVGFQPIILLELSRRIQRELVPK